MDRTFKPGDTVICVDDEFSHGYLTAHSQYTVKAVIDYGDIEVSESPGIYWMPKRFRLLHETADAAPFLEIKNEMICPFDVDETLVLERPVHSCSHTIVNPYTGETEHRLVHEGHIKLMRHMHGRGRFIVVWSGNGVLWAKAVVEALGIQDYVHLVMTKPIAYVDDLPSNSWLNNQIYFKPKE